MKFSRMKKLINSSILLSALILSCTGCGNSNMDELVSSKDETLVHETSATVVVEKGELTPSYEMSLELAGFEEHQYNMLQNEYNKFVQQYEIEVDEVLAGVGDVVEKGDTLVSFKSEKLDSQKVAKRKEITEKNLEIEHLQRLMAIDPNEDHTSEIRILQNDVNVAELYLTDIDEIYHKINIIAEESGTVTHVNDKLAYGFVDIGKTLVTVASNDGYYTFETQDDIPLEFGKAYKAESASSASEYSLVAYDSLDSIASSTDATEDSEDTDDTEDESDDADKKKASDTDAQKAPAGGTRKFYFKPVEDKLQLQKNLNVNITMRPMQDVVYVDKRAVSFKDDGDCYVIRINEDGTRTGIKIDVGQIYGNVVTIKNGLQGGETLCVY